MKEINIARVITKKRKEKGVTQEELAKYIGVSGASVSKWETEQSYPDILLLPQLAAYFNISIDELLDYSPQMSKKDIAKLYYKLYQDLSNKPFDEVIEQCREKVKEYFSCFPLLLQMGEVLINASGMIDDPEKSLALVSEAKDLFVRVKNESDNIELIKSALFMEATCLTMLGNHNEVIELLGKPPEAVLPYETLLSLAYQMTERYSEAESVLQVGIYQYVFNTLSLLSSYAMLAGDNADRLNEIVERTWAIIEAFKVKELQPATIINFSIVAAQGYLARQDIEKSLDMLEQYVEIVTGDISLRLQGDSFFNLVVDWLDVSHLGDKITPDDSLKQSLVNAVIGNPEFAVLNDHPRFQSIAKKLETLFPVENYTYNEKQVVRVYLG